MYSQTNTVSTVMTNRK